jgi:DNA-directed RNA polymerase subunit beta'
VGLARHVASSTSSRSSASPTPRAAASRSASRTSSSREKDELLQEAQKRVERFQRAYQTGNITNGERYNKVIDTWTHANNDVAEAMVTTMRRVDGGFNPCS